MPITPFIVFGTTPIVQQSATLHFGTTVIPVTYVAPTYPVPDEIGIIEALTEIIGESDNEIGGFRMTRVSSVITQGDTTFNVHSVLDWPTSGTFALDGVKYYYTSRTDSTLVGITHVAGGSTVNGAIIDHRVDSAVVDTSGEWSAIELLRRAILVNYAEGSDLDAVGRNVGVDRLPTYEDDTQFRQIIKALAYNPKGTVYGLELALDSLLGAGNYEIIEDLLQYPNTVFIKITGGLGVSTEVQGKAFLSGPGYGILGDGALGPTEIALPVNTISVGSVKLHPINELFLLTTAKASALTYEYFPGHVGGNAFTYQGSEAEGTAVTVSANGYNIFQNAGPGGTAYYDMDETQGARVTPEAYVEVSGLLHIPTGSNLGQFDYDQISLAIYDGAVKVNVGVGTTPLTVNLYDTVGSGGEVGSPASISLDTWHEITVKKYGTERVELWVDGKWICSEPYSSFTQVTATYKVLFGIRPNTLAGAIAWYRKLGVEVVPPNEYWSMVSTGSAATANPNRFTSGVTDPNFETMDVGKCFITRNSTATNGGGGNNNGRWVVDSYVDADNLELIGATLEDAIVSTANPNRITLADRDLTFPDDLGKTITIEGTGVNAGDYVIAELRDPDNPSVNLASAATPLTQKTNVCEVTAGGFTSEGDLDVHLQPSFVTEASLDYELCDAGEITGTSPNQVADLRLGPAIGSSPMKVDLTHVLSSQILSPSVILNSVISESPLLFEYYPFYLGDPLGSITAFVDALTAAGVIPEIIVE